MAEQQQYPHYGGAWPPSGPPQAAGPSRAALPPPPQQQPSVFAAPPASAQPQQQHLASSPTAHQQLPAWMQQQPQPQYQRQLQYQSQPQHQQHQQPQHQQLQQPHQQQRHPQQAGSSLDGAMGGGSSNGSPGGSSSGDWPRLPFNAGMYAFTPPQQQPQQHQPQPRSAPPHHSAPPAYPSQPLFPGPFPGHDYRQHHSSVIPLPNPYAAPHAAQLMSQSQPQAQTQPYQASAAARPPSSAPSSWGAQHGSSSSASLRDSAASEHQRGFHPPAGRSQSSGRTPSSTLSAALAPPPPNPSAYDSYPANYKPFYQPSPVDAQKARAPPSMPPALPAPYSQSQPLQSSPHSALPPRSSASQSSPGSSFRSTLSHALDIPVHRSPGTVPQPYPRAAASRSGSSSSEQSTSSAYHIAQNWPAQPLAPQQPSAAPPRREHYSSLPDMAAPVPQHQAGLGTAALAMAPRIFAGTSPGQRTPVAPPQQAHFDSPASVQSGYVTASPNGAYDSPSGSSIVSGNPSPVRMPRAQPAQDGSPLRLKRPHPGPAAAPQSTSPAKMQRRTPPVPPSRAEPLPLTPSKMTMYVEVPVLSPPTRARYVSGTPITPRVQVDPSPAPSTLYSGPVSGPSSRPTLPIARAPQPSSMPLLDDEGWDSQDAEGSEYEDDEIELIPTQSSGAQTPANTRVRRLGGTLIRISGGVVKSSARRAPTQRLIDLMEDLFEADDMLPDRDELSSAGSQAVLPGMCEQYFDILGGVAVPKSSVLRDILRAAAQSARASAPVGIARGTAANASPEKIVPGAPLRLADIDPQRLARLMRIIERGIRTAESIEVLPPAPAAATTTAPAKKGKGKTATIARKAAQRASASRSRSRSPRKSREPDDEDGRESEADKSDAEKEDQALQEQAAQKGSPEDDGLNTPPLEENPDHQQMALSVRINLVTYSVLAAECCLAILSGEDLPKHLISEDLIRPCVESIKLALDRVILPFVEACGGAMGVHPMLERLVQDLAPVVKRGRGRPSAAKTKAVQREEEARRTHGTRACSDALARMFRETGDALRQVQRLVNLPSVTLSEAIVISAVYAAVQPFFVNEPDPGGASEGKTDAAKAAARGRVAISALGGGTAAMKSLRLPCLNLLRSIFARHADLRNWIIEEILTNLIKLPDMKKNRRQYSLRTGRHIHSVTALLLQLVQASSDGAAVAKAGAVYGTADAAAAQGLNEDADGDAEDESNFELAGWARSLEGPKVASRDIASYLMQRVNAGGKVVKASSENSYVAIVDNLVGDLLATLFLPEWPAAALLLTELCRAFANMLEDSKSSPEARGVALEHLGPIAARLREGQLRCTRLRLGGTQELADAPKLSQMSTYAILDIETHRDLSRLDAFNAAYKSILEHLDASEKDDQTAETASDFLASQWGCELAAALVRTISALDALDEEDASSAGQAAQLKGFVAALGRSLSQAAARAAQKGGTTSANVFEMRSEDDYRNVTDVTEVLVSSSAFMVTHDFLLRQLILSLDGQAVGNRTRALRGLGRISSVDEALLDNADVREAIETRLSDESASVRETTLSLLGRFALRTPERLEKAYPLLCERINDSGLAVRKRALRFLANAYALTKAEATRVDACVRIVRCVFDEDVGMQDLAVGTIGAMWLDLAAPTENKVGRPPKTSVLDGKDDAAEDMDLDDDVLAVQVAEAKVEDKVLTLIAVANAIRERPSPLEAVLERVMLRCEPEEMPVLLGRLRNLGDAMIDSLVDAQDLPSSALVERIRTVYLLVSTNPSVISIAKAKALLPFLKGAQTSDDFLILELLLKIFRASLPSLPKTASTFAEALERALTPLVSKPPNRPAAPVLQELIACYCTVINTSTHRFPLLIKTLKFCLRSLRALRKRLGESGSAPMSTKEETASRVLMSMLALLCEHADFDKMRSQHVDHAPSLNEVTQGSISEDVFLLMLSLYELAPTPGFGDTAMRSLGFIFRAYPSFTQRSRMAALIQRTLSKGSVPERELVLKIILELLATEQKRAAPEVMKRKPGTTIAVKSAPSPQKKVDMSELVGNTETFADSGVSAALIQSYLDAILRASREIEHAFLQRAAMEILKFTVQQGLSHPLQCVPTLIALETVADETIASKALYLHDYLASKHASILAARYLDFARASFDFQRVVCTGPVRGYRTAATSGAPSALLRHWYTLVRDKRNTRLDFLKAITRGLDVNTASGKCTELHVTFARYVADNLAVLEYKTLEEVFVVLAQLRSMLGVTGMMVLQYVEDELAADAGDSDHEGEQCDDEMPTPEPEPVLGKMDESGEQASQAEPAIAPRAPKWPMFSTTRAALVMGTCILLRNHLKTVYGISEAKIRKWQPGKRQSSGADRPATRRVEGAALCLSFVPLHQALEAPATRDKDTARLQMAAFEELIRAEELDDAIDDEEE